QLNVDLIAVNRGIRRTRLPLLALIGMMLARSRSRRQTEERDEECKPHPFRSPDRLAANSMEEDKGHDAPEKSKGAAKPGLFAYVIEMPSVSGQIAAGEKL